MTQANIVSGTLFGPFTILNWGGGGEPGPPLPVQMIDLKALRRGASPAPQGAHRIAQVREGPLSSMFRLLLRSAYVLSRPQ